MQVPWTHQRVSP
jgi:integrase